MVQNIPTCRQVMPKGRNYKLNFAHVAFEAGRKRMKSRKYLVYDVFTDKRAGGQSARRRARLRGAGHGRHAGDRARVQPVGIGFHPAAGQSAPPRQGAHLHAGLRDAVRRPSDGRLGDRACRTGGRRRHRRHVRAGGEHRAGALRRRPRAAARPSPSSTCRSCREQLALSADAAALGAALGLAAARDRLREPPRRASGRPACPM